VRRGEEWEGGGKEVRMRKCEEKGKGVMKGEMR
jgi:hypothetical protein